MKATLHLCGLAGLLLVQSFTVSAIVFTNDTVISPLQTNYEGQDIVISNCTLTVDGSHLFASLRAAAGATLTHSAAPGGNIIILGSATNEAQILTGTNAVALANSNVFLPLVVVRDVTATITYSNTLDYMVFLANSFA